MDKFYFFYGSQVAEFERPKIRIKKSAKVNIKPSKTRVVLSDVHD